MRVAERGQVLVVSGPSGVGKSTLVTALRAHFPDLGFSVSATTRAPRTGEQDGVDYDFLDLERFEELVRKGEFLEHATVYGHRYGTLRWRVEAEVAAGRSVLLDIDAQGSALVRATLPEAAHVFIAPPSVAALAARLRARGTDDEATITRRMRQAAEQIAAAPTYDFVVVNDVLDVALDELVAVVRALRTRADRVRPHIDLLLAELAAAGQGA